MKELQRILTAHARRYPLMEPTDAVKLIYQNEFGCGHFIRDEAAAMDYLRREHAQTERAQLPLYEEIGNGILRANLAPLQETDLEQLGERFIRCAEAHKGSLQAFLRKLEVLRELTAQGIFGFGTDALNRYLEAYAEAGYPPVSHSQAYRNAYRPAYRVICREKENAQLAAVCKAIDSCLEDGIRKIVAIDGRCASGKSTLAQRLQSRYGCTVISMDDFFLQAHQRTEQRLSTPGENIDHERFLEEVLQPLRAGEAVSYRPFDCGSFTLAEPVTVPESMLTVVEGSYSCHKDLREYYDLRIFLTVEPEEQLRRILRRNGAKLAEMFRSRWIPMEEAYFAAFDVPGKADLLLDTTE